MVTESLHKSEALTLLPSPEAAQLVTGVLEGHVNYLEENGFQNVISRSHRDIFHLTVPGLYDADYEYVLYNEQFQDRDKSGYIEWLEITREQMTGRITGAEIATVLPSSISAGAADGSYRGDGWHARLQFPSGKDVDTTPDRVVIDTWGVPLTEISKAMKALSNNYSEEELAKYSKFHEDVYKNKDVAGLPVAATDKRHIVLGREEVLEPTTKELVTSILNLFDEGVRDEVTALRMFDMTMAAEETMDANPSVISQLRIVLSGMRTRRQEVKRDIGSPFEALKKATDLSGKQARTGRRSLEAQQKIADQIAVGDAIRAERAARRASLAAQ